MAVKNHGSHELLTAKKRLPGFGGEWVEKYAYELGEFIRGVSYNPQNDLYFEENYDSLILLRANNIVNYNLSLSDVYFVNKLIVNKNQILKVGDIILCMANGSKNLVGKSAYYDGVELGRITFGAFMGVFRTFKNLASRRFLKYIFQSNQFIRYIRLILAGSAINNLTPNNILDFSFSIPTQKKEQAAIASALSDAYSLISSLEQLIAKKRLIKQGAMQELLTGKKRLPGFAGEWVEKRIGDIAEIIGGGTPSTTDPSYWNGTIPWFVPAEISTSKKYIAHSDRNITRKGLENSSAKLLPPGAILLTTRATIGLKAILEVPATTNQGFQSLVVKNGTDKEFIYYILEIIQPKLMKVASGSTFLEISPHKLSAIYIFLPETQEEQTAIASILSDMDEEIDALEAKLAKARKIREGMMAELLTGRIRLV